MNITQIGLFNQPPPLQPNEESKKEGNPAPESMQQSTPVAAPVPSHDPAPPSEVVLSIVANKKKQALESLGHFTGTTEWHKWSALFKNFLLTDGAHHVAEEYGAYWPMDAIASYYSDVRKYPFQVWKLAVDKESNTAILTATNGNEKQIARQEILYTDFPDDITLFVAFSGEGYWVILLPSEY